MKVQEPVLAVLSRCSTQGHILKLPEQLDRKMYEAVNTVLAAAGGKWNRAIKGHIFTTDAEDAME